MTVDPIFEILLHSRNPTTSWPLEQQQEMKRRGLCVSCGIQPTVQVTFFGVKRKASHECYKHGMCPCCHSAANRPKKNMQIFSPLYMTSPACSYSLPLPTTTTTTTRGGPRKNVSSSTETNSTAESDNVNNHNNVLPSFATTARRRLRTPRAADTNSDIAMTTFNNKRHSTRVKTRTSAVETTTRTTRKTRSIFRRRSTTANRTCTAADINTTSATRRNRSSTFGRRITSWLVKRS